MFKGAYKNQVSKSGRMVTVSNGKALENHPGSSTGAGYSYSM